MGERKLVLLHTNDIHSHFERMPPICEALRQLRSKHAASDPIVIDCGDHMDRMRPETEGSEGFANIAVLNETGYDLIVPGNNEGLTMTPDHLSAAYSHRQGYSVVCGNLRLARTGEPPAWLEPYRILNRNGLRVGVIGLTAYYPDFYSLLGWTIAEPLGTAAELVKRIRPDVDIVVVVSHLGINNDKAMAEQIEGIDIIIGSHTHHLLEQPLYYAGTFIAAAGCFGQYVGELEFGYDPDQGNLRLLSGICHSTENFPSDPQIEALIREQGAASRKRLERPAALTDRSLPINWGAESELGNLLASGIRRWTKAEIGLVNAGQLLQSLDAGTVTFLRLLEICPSPINPCLIRLRGEHIRLALEEALLDEFIRKPLKGFGFRGKELGTLCLSGMRVEYAAGGEPYRKIRSVTVGGEELKPERLYEVGTIDMFTFGIGYLSLGRGETVTYFLPEFIRDVLAKQLGDPDEIRECAIPRWFAI
ncbi:bifunctional metallophosphatase/5'-nucleotidase [Paenibacillus ginsengarvi]|uniref:Bifunctional metallophosphatase/5'-nucleotidase n=1 Tax=Paenibacillus ginsengarvi TaxID=400777 RepID=A0A3B0CPI6_9BACL|nr:bifunctional UDP-sugar hydrolase/5'-nucleotidase [Paenibacillus ginsengarvi]RKN85636.1 bifunctional metallophosphatase/5'-nucleotidase [Paenibacillus ginsengarvi]